MEETVNDQMASRMQLRNAIILAQLLIIVAVAAGKLAYVEQLEARVKALAVVKTTTTYRFATTLEGPDFTRELEKRYQLAGRNGKKYSNTDVIVMTAAGTLQTTHRETIIVTETRPVPPPKDDSRDACL